MKKLIEVIVIFLCLANTSYSQSHNKRDVYILFKEDEERGIYKEHRAIKGNFKESYDIYWYKCCRDTNRLNFAYVPISSKNYIYINKVGSNVQTIDSLSKIPAFGYDTTDKRRYPFTRVFIVEYLKPNRYKVLQVNTYIGSDY